jgi:hypothetical protein
MTNRTDYQDIFLEPTTKEAEINFIADILRELGDELTFINASRVLLTGLTNAPEKWLLTMDDLNELWPRPVEA